MAASHSVDRRTVRVRSARGATPAAGRPATPGPSAHGGSASGMIAVTTRPAVRERVRAVAVLLRLGAPHFVTSVCDLRGANADADLLCLDLLACGQQYDIVRELRSWASSVPGRRIVAFAPLVDRERELRTALALARGVRGARVHVMTASDFFDDRLWRRIRVVGERARLEAAVRARLLAAVRATGRSMPSADLVLDVLRRVSSGAAPDESRRATLAVEAQSSAETMRKLQWRSLRAAGQLPASWLRLVFHVVWYVTLRDAGWPAVRIAAFLGIPSLRHFRRRVRRRLGVPFRDLRRLTWMAAFAWAGEVVTGGRPTGDRRTLRALTGGLHARSAPEAKPRWAP